jgi:hypothetical protein
LTALSDGDLILAWSLGALIEGTLKFVKAK